MFIDEGLIIDPHYYSTVVLTENEAKKRAELISDIEYTFSLALKEGDFYFGQAEINFYLERLPETDTELFLNCGAMAVSYLTINEDLKEEQRFFEGQKIRLEVADLK